MTLDQDVAPNGWILSYWFHFNQIYLHKYCKKSPLTTRLTFEHCKYSRKQILLGIFIWKDQFFLCVSKRYLPLANMSWYVVGVVFIPITTVKFLNNINPPSYVPHFRCLFSTKINGSTYGSLRRTGLNWLLVKVNFDRMPIRASSTWTS